VIRNNNVRFEVFTAVTMMATVSLGFGVIVLEKHAADVTPAVKMETVCFSETSASTDECTRRQNAEERHCR
jgi:hypothetical protein